MDIPNESEVTTTLRFPQRTFVSPQELTERFVESVWKKIITISQQSGQRKNLYYDLEISRNALLEGSSLFA